MIEQENCTNSWPEDKSTPAVNLLISFVQPASPKWKGHYAELRLTPNQCLITTAVFRYSVAGLIEPFNQACFMHII